MAKVVPPAVSIERRRTNRARLTSAQVRRQLLDHLEGVLDHIGISDNGVTIIMGAAEQLDFEDLAPFVRRCEGELESRFGSCEIRSAVHIRKLEAVSA